jgi:hypothetical protein
LLELSFQKFSPNHALFMHNIVDIFISKRQESSALLY